MQSDYPVRHKAASDRNQDQTDRHRNGHRLPDNHSSHKKPLPDYEKEWHGHFRSRMAGNGNLPIGYY